MFKTVLALIILAVFYFIYLIYYRTKVDKNLELIIEEGATLLDVRTITEFSRGHLNEAINIPISDLKHKAVNLDKNKVIITYCSHGIRSYNAVKILNKLDYTNVYNGGAMRQLKKYLE